MKIMWNKLKRTLLPFYCTSNLYIEISSIFSYSGLMISCDIIFETKYRTYLYDIKINVQNVTYIVLII